MKKMAIPGKKVTQGAMRRYDRPSDSIALALRMRAPIFTSDQLLDQSGVETDEPSPNPSLEADKLKEYLEKMDPQDFGKFNP